MILMTYSMILKLNFLKRRSRLPRTRHLEIISYQSQGQTPVTSTFRTKSALKEREQERIHQPAVAWQQVTPTCYKQSAGQTGTQTRSNASIHLFINVLGHQAQAMARRDKTRTAPFLMLTTSRSNHSPFYSGMNSRPCHQRSSVSSTATGRRISTIETSWSPLIQTPCI